MWILNELARLDRHRFLHVGAERIGSPSLNPRTSRNVRIEDLQVTEGPLSFAIVDGLEEAEIEGGEDSAILARLTTFPIDPNLEMHMEWESAIEIGFDQDRLPGTLSHLAGSLGLGITFALRDIVPDIQEVFRALAPFLPAEPLQW